MRVVVDTDAGVDDAIAILMVLHAFPGDQVVGITTVFGNVDVHQAGHNVAHMLKSVEHDSDIPIYSGAAKPIIASVNEEKWAGHGPDGLGGESGKVETPLTAAKRNEAVHALINLAHQYKDELVIVAVGPLTNVALAILLDPSFISNVKQLVVMGGLSRGEGNHTPHSEFNVSCDPEATNIVYQHCTAEKLHVVPFETCSDNSLPWETFDQIFHAEANAKGEYIRKVWKFTRAFCEHEGFLPCDAYAVAILLHPEYIKKSLALNGSIHLAPDEKRGACIWDSDCPPEKANVTLVTEIDTRVFIDLLHHLAG
ncbi:Envelope glycoprotein [Phytophthora boehmeriae]|uniref:Envelope glycoprotein n=1 Tax=Phytophthora boehmeriae TaxID=109152 RepID=A0A8T1WVS5_9STRA|nr:Envelope glycoprotein [Phytophthora boehmeriae]